MTKNVIFTIILILIAPIWVIIVAKSYYNVGYQNGLFDSANITPTQSYLPIYQFFWNNKLFYIVNLEKKTKLKFNYWLKRGIQWL